MAEIGKFIFTDEGRRMLVAQNGGIHFAVMGAILLSNSLNEDTIKGITWETLKAGNYGTLGLKGISYTTGDGNGIITTDPNYADALEHIIDKQSTYLFETVYQPDLGIKDKDNNVYGLYSFAFDRTKFTCNGTATFKTIILMGKQYVTDYDAKYNVDETQKPTVVGALTAEETPLAEFDSNDGNNRNKYTAYKFEWRVTVTENPVEEPGISADALSEINEKFRIINDGIKTNPDINVVSFAEDDETIHDLGLNKNGNFATTKSMLIANAYDANNRDECLNNPALLNIVNKHVKHEDVEYKPQQIISTYSYDNADTPDTIDVTHVITSLTGKGDDAISVMSPTNGTDVYNVQSPLSHNSVSETKYSTESCGADPLAVNFFGTNNSAYDVSHAMFIAADDNIDISKIDNRLGGNIYLGSNNNIYNWQDESHAPYNKSVFVNSEQNYAVNSYGNLYLNSKNNYIDDAQNNVLIDTSKAKYLGNAQHNIDIGTIYTRYVGLNKYYASTNAVIKGTSAIIKGASYNFLAQTYNCSALSADGNAIINAVNSCVKYDTLLPEGSNYPKHTKYKTLINGVGLKGMGQTRELIMGMYNAPHYTYGVIYRDYYDSYDKYRGAWCQGDRYIDQAPIVNSIFTIGAGSNDVIRRNSLEFANIDPLEYADYFGMKDGQDHLDSRYFYGQSEYKILNGTKVGHLTTDIIKAHDAYFIDDPNRGKTSDYIELAYGIMTDYNHDPNASFTEDSVPKDFRNTDLKPSVMCVVDNVIAYDKIYATNSMSTSSISANCITILGPGGQTKQITYEDIVKLLALIENQN